MSAVETSQTDSGRRGMFLTVMAILLVVLAISDFTKVFQHHSNPEMGLVILGHKFRGTFSNLTLGWLFGLFLLSYAYGLWNMKRWVIPMSVFYAFYVPVNMILFWSLHQLSPPTVRFIVFYLFVSLTGSIGIALYLAFHRDHLRY
jgi:hypothetical protein